MPDESTSELLKRLESLERQNDELRRGLQRLRADIELSDTATETGDAPVKNEVLPSAVDDRRSPRPPTPGVTEAHRGLDLEFWLGGRGLLLIGVVALVVAVGFFVEYSIEQGWLGPAVRVLLGAAVGMAAVVVGERVRARGYRIYGLWVAAGGFSAIYVSIWAAATLYSLVGSPIALALMVSVVSMAAAMGWRRASQSFVALAAFGGYLAPLLLEVDPASIVFGLVYLGILSGAALWLAAASAWPWLAALAIAGGSLMTLPGAGGGVYVFYLIALVGVSELIGRWRRWPEISAEALGLGWLTLWLGAGDWEVGGLALSFSGAGLWLVGLIAYVGVRDWDPYNLRPEVGDSRIAAGPASRRAGLAELAGLIIMVLPACAFYATALAGIADTSLSDHSEVIALGLGLVLGALYLGEGRLGERGRGIASRAWRLGLGFALWLVAPATAWSGLTLTDLWLLEGLLFTAAGMIRPWGEARVAGLAAFGLAILAYYGALSGRPAEDAAFVSGWALTGLAVAVAPAAWALGQELVKRAMSWESAARPLLFLASAAFFLGWGTSEILRFYRLLAEPEAWTLARDLSISGFWLAYASSLLAVGFWLDRPPVRWAGLGMALVTAAKVFLYDLSNLAELYRIVSFLLLAAVLLALSFRYQRLRPAPEE